MTLTMLEQEQLFLDALPVFLHGTTLQSATAAASLEKTATEPTLYAHLLGMFAATAGASLQAAYGPIIATGNGLVAPNPLGHRTPTMNTAAAIVSAAANKDSETVTALALAAANAAPEEAGQIMLAVGGMARSLHRLYCTGDDRR